jgi:hypothetical protein
MVNRVEGTEAMAAKERAGWEYEPGQTETQDILGMTDAEAGAALVRLLRQNVRIAETEVKHVESGPCPACEARR